MDNSGENRLNVLEMKEEREEESCLEDWYELKIEKYDILPRNCT